MSCGIKGVVVWWRDKAICTGHAMVSNLSRLILKRLSRYKRTRSRRVGVMLSVTKGRRAVLLLSISGR